MMSDRERWVVYPLLIFALALAVKNKITMLTGFESSVIRCNTLVVESTDGQTCVELGQNENLAGVVNIYNAAEQPVVRLHGDAADRGGQIEVSQNDVRNPQVIVMASKDGGAIRLPGFSGVSSLFLGHNKRRGVSGLMATNEQGLLELWLKLLKWPNGYTEENSADQRNGNADKNEEVDEEERERPEASDTDVKVDAAQQSEAQKSINNPSPRPE